MDNKKNKPVSLAFWKSMDEYNNGSSPDKVHEFAEGVTDEFKLDEMSPINRRRFLALMTASASFAAVACTDYRDKGEIISYNKKPEDATAGIATHYASSCTACSLACGTLVKAREGRPIKIDGNPEHPFNKGKLCSKGHANIMNLYDPERLRYPQRRSESELILFRNDYNRIKWANLDKEIITALQNSVNSGKEIALITHTIVSPTLNKLINEFQAKYPTTKKYSYEVINDRNRQSAWKKCYGESNFPVIDLSQANIILSIESDFLGNEGDFVENIAQFTARRNFDDLNNFNRLYSVEAGFSLTGSNSDYRLRLKPERMDDFLLSLIAELSSRNAITLDPSLTGKIAVHSLEHLAKHNDLDLKILKHLVDDLAANRGKSIVLAGNTMPESLHIFVNLLNNALGNEVLYNTASQRVKFGDVMGFNDMEPLVTSLNEGKVGVVIHFDTNPVYELPADLNYVKALSKAGLVVSMSENVNETSQHSRFVLPINHDLESWGDTQTRTGQIGLQQPLIAPLYDSRQKEAILLSWLSGKPEDYKEDIYHQYLMKSFETDVYPKANAKVDFRTFWFSALHDGFVTFREPVAPLSTFNKQAFLDSGEVEDVKGFTLILQDNYTIGADGRFANNGWLQELPHPVSKITWDNYASLSPSTANSLDVKMGNMIRIESNGRKLELPVIVQPGLADGVVTTELGFGREHGGSIGTGVGVDTNRFMTKKGGLTQTIYTGVHITKMGTDYQLVSTQEHHSLNDDFVKDQHRKREIIREATILGYQKNPEIIHEKQHPDISMIPPVEYKDVKWSMTIDMNKCIGCAQCVTSCNVENNIPIVGKEQVSKGREMHWMRIDRYYSGTPEEPIVSNQPMLCQHCDKAPCENVCPVVATSHSPDGLNQMAYNRCVGTRYCSNNCPYKVRRYNFFDFRDNLADGFYKQDSIHLMHNPEVTVRSRGVMEKCTFCIQRIMEARSDSTRDGKQFDGSKVTTACQDACPASAISFGNINNKNSEVYKLKYNKLGYHLLEELNIKPNVSYIAKLRNIHSEEI